MSSPRKTAKKKTSKKTATSKGKGAALLDPKQLATYLGVTLTPPLKPHQTSRLRKAVPGYAGILDDCAALLDAEGAGFSVAGVTPEDLLAVQKEQKFLATREAVAYAVYRSLFEQRLQVDDRGMKMLEKLARKINTMREDDPALVARWKLLLDFLGAFRSGGGNRAAPAGEPDAEKPDAIPADA